MTEVNFLKANWNLLDGFKSDQSKGIDHPDVQKPVDGNTSVIDLPAVQPGVIPDMNILEVINSRRSVREFTNDPVSLEELSWLLWSTQGIQKVLRNGLQPCELSLPGANAIRLKRIYSSIMLPALRRDCTGIFPSITPLSVLENRFLLKK